MPVVSTDDVLGGDPRLDGRRISVLQIADLIHTGNSPQSVADQLEISLAEVHEAMAYYYNHPEEMEALQEAYLALEEDLGERSEAHHANQ